MRQGIPARQGREDVNKPNSRKASAVRLTAGATARHKRFEID
ncbi:hypothetical protein [Nocardia sp. NPDC051750]